MGMLGNSGGHARACLGNADGYHVMCGYNWKFRRACSGGHYVTVMVGMFGNSNRKIPAGLRYCNPNLEPLIVCELGLRRCHCNSD